MASGLKLLARVSPLQYRLRMAQPDYNATSGGLTSPASPGSGETPSPDGLPRRIGLWTAVAILVGSTIGSGIFRSPAGIATKLPGPLPMLTVWAVGGLFALCGALALA